MGCLWSRLLWCYRTFYQYQCFVCHSISVFRFGCFIIKNVLSHICWLTSRSSLRSLHRYYCRFLLKEVVLVLTKITYCRDGQLIWLGGTLRWPRLADRWSDSGGTEFIAPDELFKTATNTETTKRHSRLSSNVPQLRVRGGPHLLSWS